MKISQYPMFAGKFSQVSLLTLGLITSSYFANISIDNPLINIQSAQASGECGPSNSSIGTAATKFFLFPYNSRFKPACQNHDICYENLKTSGKTLEQCEAEFKRDLYKICEDRSLRDKLSEDILGYISNPKLWGNSPSGPCKRQADFAYWTVSAAGEIVLTNAIYSLKVTKVEAKRIDDTFSDDELEVCVTVKNDGNLATEWDLVLLDKKGNIVDTEPDTYERNIAVGKSDKECVSTNGVNASIKDLGSTPKVVVRVDDYPGIAPFTPIASIPVATNRKKDKFTAVSFAQPSRMESFKQIESSKKQKP